MTTKRGSIHFAIPLPVAVDPASLERLTKVITDTHAAIGTFTAAIASLGGKVEYRPKGERKNSKVSPYTAQEIESLRKTAAEIDLQNARDTVAAANAGTDHVDAFAIPPELDKRA